MRALTLLVVALPLGTAAAQQQVIPIAPPPPQVVALGQGEVKVAPDRATVMVSVETRGKTAAIAGAENARITRVTLDALRAQRLAADQLSTSDYSVYPEQVWDERNRRPSITGYVARNTIRAEVRNMDQVGNVIDAALAGGATQIAGVTFWSSNLQQARRQALQRAVEQACLDAAALARGTGRVLGAPLEVTSMEYGAPPPMPMAVRATAKDMAESVPTPINPGEQTLTVHVQTRWALVAGSADTPACAR